MARARGFMPNLIATRVSDMPLDKRVVSILRVLDYLTKLYNFFSYFYLALIAKKSESQVTILLM